MRTMTMDRASNSLLISIVEDYRNFLLSFFETWMVVDGAVYTLHTLLNDHDIDSKWDFYLYCGWEDSVYRHYY